MRHHMVDQPRAEHSYLGGVAVVGGTVPAAAGVVHSGAAEALTIFVAAIEHISHGGRSVIDDRDGRGPRSAGGSRHRARCWAALGCVAAGAAVAGLAQEVEVGRPSAAARVQGATVAIPNQRVAVARQGL